MKTPPTPDDASFLQLRVRGTVSGAFVWDLMTLDGHVVNSSDVFSRRADCIADARQHGLPILGINEIEPSDPRSTHAD